MKRYVLTVICVAMSFLCAAQNGRFVRGAVFDADGIPLQGAVVKAVGTDSQITVNQDGTFVFEVSYMVRSLEASKEAYVSQTIEVDGSFMAFRLKVDKKYIENKARAEENARIAAQEQAKKAAADKARAEEEAKKAEAAKVKAAEDARRLAEENAKKEAAAKLKAEEEAKKAEAAKAKAAEEARRQAEENAKKEAAAKLKAEQEAREAAIKKAKQDSLALVKEAAKADRKAVNQAYNEKYRNKGVVHNFELVYGLGFVGEQTVIYENYGYRSFASPQPVEFTYSIGHRFCNWVSLSAGTGICYEILDLTDWNDRFSSVYNEMDHGDLVNYSNILVPVFLNSKFYLSRGAHQPLVSLTFGSYLMPSDAFTYVDAGLGYNIRASRRSNLYFMASIATHPTLCAYKIDSNTYYANRQNELELRFKIGFTF